MKKSMLIIASALVMVSCSKDWNCTVTTDQEYMGQTSHSENQVTFTGTKEEMEAYEVSGTKDYPNLQQTTVCH